MLLSGSPASAILETVPGIASVLRSPTADALVNTIRAAAGSGSFRMEDARELLQYATRRGLIGIDEGERLIAEVETALVGHRGRGVSRPAPKAAHRPSPKPVKRAPAKKKPAKKRR